MKLQKQKGKKKQTEYTKGVMSFDSFFDEAGTFNEAVEDDDFSDRDDFWDDDYDWTTPALHHDSYNEAELPHISNLDIDTLHDVHQIEDMIPDSQEMAAIERDSIDEQRAVEALLGHVVEQAAFDLGPHMPAKHDAHVEDHEDELDLPELSFDDENNLDAAADSNLVDGVDIDALPEVEDDNGDVAESNDGKAAEITE